MAKVVLLKHLIRSRLLVCTCLVLLSSIAEAQVMDTGQKVDTLKLNERISFRTNMVDWVFTTPNIGVEFDLFDKNWNRWAVGLSLRGNWQSSHTIKPGMVYNISGARMEFRNYYRIRQIGDPYPKAHTEFIDKLFSCRRPYAKHPTTTYYRGAYLSYNDFSIKLGKEGKQGSAMTLGFTWGVVKPMYVFKNGNSLDIEMGVSAGFAYAKYNKYEHNRESDCYPVIEVKGWHLVPHPVLSDLRVGFVYRLGNYPVTKKYRWRYDCDLAYQDTILNRILVEENMAADRKRYKQEYGKVDSLFMKVYLIEATKNKATEDSLARLRPKEKITVGIVNGVMPADEAKKQLNKKIDNKQNKKKKEKKQKSNNQETDNTDDMKQQAEPKNETEASEDDNKGKEAADEN